MGKSTLATVLSAIPDSREIVELLGPLLQKLGDEVRGFRSESPTPERTYAFEKKAAEILREAGRRVVEHEFNHLEPEQREDCPLRLRLARQEYRRRPKSRKRIGTLFGEIELQRYLYEATEPGERCLVPLEMHLGIEAGLATPALAERVGLWSAEHEQAQVRHLLQHEHGVSWSVKSLRKVAASLRDGLASFREQAQMAKVLEWLEQAEQSKGRHRPGLSAGRDGIQLPMRGDGYREGATATLSVLDRRGKRLGTVYLGRMPESGQGTLSAQLTSLLTKTLAAWHGRGRRAPRLAYVTDAGDHPKKYYQVLRRLDDPWRPGHKLEWQWVLDFWHACGYVNELAEGLFGKGGVKGVKAWTWFRRWKRWLRDRRHGVSNVLRSAMALYNKARKLSQARDKLFWKGYGYLRKHAVWMRYWEYRQQGMPIGSGVTEAACKTVFAERLKRSGMTWGHEGGQVIVDLRVLVLSRVWQAVHQTYLRSRPQPEVIPRPSHSVNRTQIVQIAA